MKSVASSQLVMSAAPTCGNADGRIVPAMPLVEKPPEHSPQLDRSDPIACLFEAIQMVAKVMTKTEITNSAAAKKAMDEEFYGLQKAGTWNINKVRPKHEVAAEARRQGKVVHFARVFGICSVKGSELPEGHKDRKYKGRFVYDGRTGAVRDQISAAALHEDLGSSPATLESSKLVDADGLVDGNSSEQADAIKAYVQAKLTGPKSWVSLPQEYWPAHFRNIENPVVPLDYALYGHPDAGTSWEHTIKHIHAQGYIFQNIDGRTYPH